MERAVSRAVGNPWARRIAAGGAAAFALLAILVGCSPRKMLLPNLPPETTLFVQFDLADTTDHTVNHVVQLFWFGSDPDGSVVGFELRFHNPESPGDTAWVRTTRSDSTFTVFAPNGRVRPVFEVRAIDDQEARDPSPARQEFSLTNQAPAVSLVNRLTTSDTTFASVTLSWSATDPDGDAAQMRFWVWLKGADTTLATASPFTVPTEQFRQGGQLLSGLRTVFVQPVDDGGRAGPADSMRWFVRAPVSGTRARLLLIDDVPTSNPANFATDTMYMNTAARNLSADEYSTLTLQFSQPFRSAKDVEQTFRLFEAVVWYRGTETSFSTLLRDYQSGIGAYLDRGGSILLEGLYLVGGLRATGPLTAEFASRYLGTDFFHRNFSFSLNDSTEGWGNRNGSVFRTSLYQDSLRLLLLSARSGEAGGIRAFGVRDTNHIAMWAEDGQLSPPNQGALAVGVSVPQPAGGRAIVLTFPVRAANGFGSVPRFLAKVFQQMGLTSP